MSSTVFIAVQCCQCSTMQVKQRKKSNNKWTCAVCNQKQSVIKVFAQGFVAKDLRKFVQSFNLSRSFSENLGQLETLNSFTPLSSEDCQRKRRSDWSEYLDHEGDANNDKFKQQNQEEEADDFGPKIVTELTKEMFKKPKLNYDSWFDSNNSYKAVFSKMNTTNQHLLSQGKEGKKNVFAKVTSTSKWSDCTTGKYKEQRTVQPTLATKASKWNAYITHDDNDMGVRSGINFPDDMGPCSHHVWESISDDQKVKDDIHPDFM
ncbi:MRN complex-interacting protein isoform X1 [Ricinus communis]|uniref:MRN complex-interacting protein isoform X1 n=1 Tax=Ricinus communis TaxID=3988 RepID=UPI0007724206|nr:MRN complex-interacting protein isoform X1 [Ricinus communis]|eukprot:XP_015579621.1 MRN complex-interacting protein isoform X1 [Ricinus communis]